MIPKSAKRVFKGLLFEVYQWPQRTFDGSYMTYEAIRRKDTVQVLATVGNRIILMKEEQPRQGRYLSVPGGMVEGKNHKSGAYRELLEETGMKPEKMLFWKKREVPVDIDWSSYYYIARNCRKVAEPNLDSGEKIRMRLVTFTQFVNLIQDKQFRNRDISNFFYVLSKDPKKLEAFRKELFGK